VLGMFSWQGWLHVYLAWRPGDTESSLTEKTLVRRAKWVMQGSVVVVQKDFDAQEAADQRNTDHHGPSEYGPNEVAVQRWAR